MWIDPLWHLVTAVGRYTFYIERAGCPLSGREIDRMLSARKIGHHGMNLDLEGDICLNVNKHQALQAQQLFDQHGVTVLNPYQRKMEARRPKGWREWGRPRTQSASRNPFSVFSIFE